MPDSALALDDSSSLDRALTERALAGDLEALEELWVSYRRWVAAILLAHKPARAELEDLLQEVAAMVVAKARDVRDPAAFKPWLRAVALSIARASGRKETVRRSAWERLRTWNAARAGGESEDEAYETLARSAEARRLFELAGTLPDDYREPLILKSLNGMSYREIGRVMGLPETTVETRIARARRMLRERAAESESAGTGAPVMLRSGQVQGARGAGVSA